MDPTIQTSIFSTDIPVIGIHLGEVVDNNSAVEKYYQVSNTSTLDVRLVVRSNLSSLSFFHPAATTPHPQGSSTWEIVLSPEQHTYLGLRFLPDQTNYDQLSDSDGEDIAKLHRAAEIAGSITLASSLAPVGTSNPAPHNKPDKDDLGQGRGWSSQGPQRWTEFGPATIPFSAIVCKSEIALEVGDEQVYFEHSLVGFPLVKVVTLRNLSEFKTNVSFAVKGPNASNFILSSSDTGETLDLEECVAVLGPLAPFRLCITYQGGTSSLATNRNRIIMINERDSSNTLELSISTKADAQRGDNGLMVYSQGEDSDQPTPIEHIDFGSCYAGVTACSKFCVRNTSSGSVVINLSSNCTLVSAGKVFFLVDGLQRSVGSAEQGLGTAGSWQSISSSGASSGAVRERRDPAKDSSESLLPFPSNPPRSIPKLTSQRSASPPRSETRGSFRRDTGGFEDPGRMNGIDHFKLEPNANQVVTVCFVPDDTRDEENEDDLDASESQWASAHFPLIFKKFKITIESQGTHADEHSTKTIRANARVCTSVISLSPKQINFGECNIGTKKTETVFISNLSELPAEVALEFESKCVKCRKALTIPPSQVFPLTIAFLPRKVNPDYRKQITVVNRKNPTNDLIIDIKANNIDALGVLYHSAFYTLGIPKTLVPHPDSEGFSGLVSGSGSNMVGPAASFGASSASAFPNCLDFGILVPNCPVLRCFDLTNITQSELVLGLEVSDPSEIRIFCAKLDQKEAQQRKPTADEVVFLDDGEDAFEGNLHKNLQRLVGAFADEFSYFSAANALDAAAEMAEQNYVKAYLKRKEELQRVLDDGLLSPLSRLALPPLKKCQVYLLYTLDAVTHDIKMKLRNVDSKLKISILSAGGTSGFPRVSPQPTPLTTPRDVLSPTQTTSGASALTAALRSELGLLPSTAIQQQQDRPAGFDLTYSSLLPGADVSVVGRSSGGPAAAPRLGREDSTNTNYGKHSRGGASDHLDVHPESVTCPVRELQIKAKACRAAMNISQQHINFGKLPMESQEKAIQIDNLSEVPLLYTMKKSGSISSGDLHFPSKAVGVIRPYGSRTVWFHFKPSLAGVFHEVVSVHNIQDAVNSVRVTVKANLIRPDNFWLKGLQLSFDSSVVNERSHPQFIVVKNISKTARTFKIKLAHSHCVGTDAVVQTSAPPLAKPTIIFKLDQLTTGLEANKFEREELEQFLQQKLKIAVRKKKKEKIIKYQKKLDELHEVIQKEQAQRPADDKENKQESIGNLTFTLQPNAVQNVSAQLLPWLKYSGGRDHRIENFQGVIQVYESTNKEKMKEITYTATVYLDSDVRSKLLTDIPESGNQPDATELEPTGASPTSEKTKVKSAGDIMSPSRLMLRRRSTSVYHSLPRAEKNYLQSQLFTWEIPWQFRGDSSASASTSVLGSHANVAKSLDTMDIWMHIALMDPLHLNSPVGQLLNPLLTSTLFGGTERSWVGTRVAGSAQFSLRSIAQTDLTLQVEWKESSRKGRMTLELKDDRHLILTDNDRKPRRFLHDPAEADTVDCDDSRLFLRLLPHEVAVLQLHWSQTQQTESDPSLEFTSGVLQITPVLYPWAERAVNVHIRPRFPQPTTLEPTSSIFDFGNVPVIHEKASAGFVRVRGAIELKNTSPHHEVRFMVENEDQSQGAVSIFTDVSCASVQALAKHRLRFSVVSHRPGPQRHRIYLRDLTNLQLIHCDVAFTPTNLTHLCFPGLAEQGVFDVGVCFVDKPIPDEKINNNNNMWSNVQPFRVLNTSQCDVLVRPTCNLKTQIAIFLDPSLRECISADVSETLGPQLALAAGEERTIYVGVNPYLETQAAATGQCMELAAGLTFTVRRALPAVSGVPLGIWMGPTAATSFVSEQVLRLKALIGKSLLSISLPPQPKTVWTPSEPEQKGDENLANGQPNKSRREQLQELQLQSRELGFVVVDFFATQVNRTFKGQFELVNLNELLPAKFSVIASSPTLRLEVTSGELTSEKLGGNKTSIGFEFFCKDYGVYEEHIEVMNLQCSTNPQRFTVRQFASDNRLDISLPKEGVLGNGAPQDGFGYHYLSLDCVFLEPIKNGKRRFHAHCKARKFLVRNDCPEELKLVPRTHLGVALGWEDGYSRTDESKNLFTQEANVVIDSTRPVNAKDHLVGEEHVLAARQETQICVSFQRSVEASPLDVIALEKGETKPFCGFLKLWAENSSPEIAAVRRDCRVSGFIRLSGFYAIPRAQLDKTSIDLGYIGRTSEKSLLLTCNITNLTEAPFFYSVELPIHEPIALTLDTLDLHKTPLKAHETRAINIQVDPVLMGPGKFSHNIEVINTYNPSNSLAFTIEGVLVDCLIAFSRLQGQVDISEEQEPSIKRIMERERALVLPALVVPASVRQSPADEWFNITSKFGEVINIDFAAHVVPELREHFVLQTLYRSSNTQLAKAVLRPEEEIEVRVRLEEKSANMPLEVLDGQRRLVGTLQVDYSAETFKAVEIIPVFGALTQGAVFRLSRTTIRFLHVDNQKSPPYSPGSNKTFPWGSPRIPTRVMNSPWNSPQRGPMSSHTFSESFTVANQATRPVNFRLVMLDMAVESTDSIKKPRTMLRKTSSGRLVTPRRRTASSTQPDDWMTVYGDRSLPEDQWGVVVEQVPGLRVEPMEGVIQAGEAVDIHVEVDRRTAFDRTHRVLLFPVEEEHFGQISKGGPWTLRNALMFGKSAVDEEQVSTNPTAFPSVELSIIRAKSRNKKARKSKLKHRFPEEVPQDRTENVSDHYPDILPLTISGCSVIAGRPSQYLLDVGMFDVNSGTVDKSLTLESQHERPVAYSLTILEDDVGDKRLRPWLSVEPQNGALDCIRDIDKVTLRFATDRVGRFSTYILLETLQPYSLSVIKVDLAVRVAASLASNYFTLALGNQTNFPSVPLSETEHPILDLGDVYDRQVSRHHSFVISNTSNVPLEFELSSNRNPSQCELFFSLSASTLKLFNYLTVEPGHRVRVFIYLQPLLPVREEPRRRSLGLELRDLSCKVTVSCKSLTKLEKGFTLRAQGRYPKINVSRTEVVFLEGSGLFTFVDGPLVSPSLNTSRRASGGGRKANNKWVPKGSPQGQERPSHQAVVMIKNSSRTPLTYCLCNDSQWFSVSIEDGTSARSPTGGKIVSRSEIAGIPVFVLDPGSSHRLVIAVKILTQPLPIEEHISLYNTTELRERYEITIRIRSHLTPLAQGLGNVSLLGSGEHHMTVLEHRVVKFIREFSQLCDGILSLDKDPIDQRNPRGKAVVNGVLSPTCPGGDKFQQQWRELHFAMWYITDEILHYALLGYVGHAVFPIAHLLYRTVLLHPFLVKCPSRDEREGSILEQWTACLGYFASHFSRQSRGISLLRQVEEEAYRALAKKSSTNKTKQT